MTTQTKPQKTMQSPGEIVLDEIIQDGETAELLLQSIVSETRQPRFEEIAFFKSRCGWSDRDIPSQLGRVGRAVRDKQIAGDSQAREAQATEAAKSAEVLQSEGAKLAAQIEVLQSKLNGLERAAKLSEKRLGEMLEAVVRLRQNAPQYRQDEFNARTRHIGQTIGTDCMAMEQELRFLSQMIAMDPTLPDSMDHIRRSYPDCVVKETRGNYLFYSLDYPKWQARKAELQAQLTELRPRTLQLRIEYDQAIAEIETLLDFYID